MATKKQLPYLATLIEEILTTNVNENYAKNFVENYRGLTAEQAIFLAARQLDGENWTELIEKLGLERASVYKTALLNLTPKI